ncbi:Gcd10p family-domain-containing protein [Gigaspora rosea]|uniref:tRNA (adenine(58)-N(1))-methyltransferase non-catalytic subunit TRM6 n=1 Tax=Gigaspora rosea TaxID=44941 RepID=A0A397VBG6_9GLOM|nr:Gcd10p family-domain-containing protein [Gigaspora rosea]
MNDIIGKPFGHSYEIYDSDKIKVIRNIAFYEVETIDDPFKQKLSYQDIEQLKKDRMEGQDIIKKVIESHLLFDRKTEYFKAKYIKRKESKSSRVFTPARPMLYSVWEYFFAKNPSKIRYTLSNVNVIKCKPYAKLLVVDDTQGLLITGVMERLGANYEKVQKARKILWKGGFDGTVSLGKFGTFYMNDIIGKPFGHSYEIYDSDKIKVIRNIAFYEVETIDDPFKQKLSYQDIEQLKKDRMEGQDIIKKVIESHLLFDRKTEYFKAKYIKRKESKSSRVFTPARPMLYSVWEYFFAKNPSKIRYTLSNVNVIKCKPYAKLLVVDDTQGLLITGVMERLGGSIKLCNFIGNEQST